MRYSDFKSALPFFSITSGSRELNLDYGKVYSEYRGMSNPDVNKDQLTVCQ